MVAGVGFRVLYRQTEIYIHTVNTLGGHNWAFLLLSDKLIINFIIIYESRNGHSL